MTDTEQLKELLEKASGGPWRVSYERGTTQIRTASNESIMGDEAYYPWVPENYADWDLIAMAPTLARKVIAAEKLVGALLPVMEDLCQRDMPTPREVDVLYDYMTEWEQVELKE